MPAPIGPIAQAIAEIAKVIGNWQKSAERRRMQVAIEAAEKFIQVHYREGEYAKITTERRLKLLKHYRKRFFRFNN